MAEKPWVSITVALIGAIAIIAATLIGLSGRDRIEESPKPTDPPEEKDATVSSHRSLPEEDAFCQQLTSIIRAEAGRFRSLRSEAETENLSTYRGTVTLTGTSMCATNATGSFYSCFTPVTQAREENRKNYESLKQSLRRCLSDWQESSREEEWGNYVTEATIFSGSDSLEVSLRERLSNQDDWHVTVIAYRRSNALKEGR